MLQLQACQDNTVIEWKVYVRNVDILTFANDGNAQNLDFETKGDTYLDFSETNPFGEVT